MQEFIALFKEAIFEDDVYLRPINILENNEELTILFTVSLYDTHDEIQKWKVTCIDFLDYRFTLDFVDDINLFTDHVLLWETNQEQCELYYRGTITDRNELVGALYNKHKEITSGWIDFDHYINQKLDWLFQGELGLVATGPKELINEYKKIFKERSLSVSTLRAWREPNNKKLIVFGKSYVIAEDFIFELCK